MLVALQRTGDDRDLPAAAEHIVRLLRSWGPGPDHLTGLALAGISLPSRLGPRFVDALVFTRCGVVVIAAQELGPAEWPGPGARAEAAVAAAKGALAGHDGGRYVTGLVAVVPQAAARGGGPAPDLAEDRPVADSRDGGPASGSVGSRLVDGLRGRESAAGSQGSEPGAARGGAESASGSVGSQPVEGLREPAADPQGSGAARDGAEPAPGSGENRPRSSLSPSDSAAQPQPDPPAPLLHRRAPEPVPVVLADPRGLRRIIGQHNRWRTVWSADDVLDACYALSLAHLAPPRAALLADGFPARLPTRAKLPELPAVIPVPPEPAPADDEPGPWIPPARGPVSAVFPRPRPIRQVPWGLLVVLGLLVTVGVIAAVFVAQVFHGS
ncbi:hypothetical protein [Amycolatopsis vastitatis]|uniref:hypothetical protein n=1 Tax=Amycolatopsis vastitatis TaxID=1905142 RepID=UPI001F0AF147|nr:hypothetical protein [Amycolatopsis vastitatis]